MLINSYSSGELICEILYLEREFAILLIISCSNGELVCEFYGDVYVKASDMDLHIDFCDKEHT